MGQSYCAAAGSDPWHAFYHEREYGFPVPDDRSLFERLTLEINQAGLWWLTILKKREAFRRAFDGFDPATVARYGGCERRRLLTDSGIIRNRAKIDAVIENARRIVSLSREHGSFAAWLQMHHPRSLPDWCDLFRESFRFTGKEIVREFLMSTGYLPGAHERSCPVFARIARARPPWMQTTAARGRRQRPRRAGAKRGTTPKRTSGSRPRSVSRPT